MAKLENRKSKQVVTAQSPVGHQQACQGLPAAIENLVPKPLVKNLVNTHHSKQLSQGQGQTKVYEFSGEQRSSVLSNWGLKEA